MNSLVEPMPIICTVYFVNCLILFYVFYFFVAFSVLNTTPSPTNQSGSNSMTPENVPPTTRTTAASSTEKSMMIHSTAGIKINITVGISVTFDVPKSVFFE